MASTHPRKNSSRQQISLILPDGKRTCRSLHTSDPHKASQIADSTQALVNALTGQQKARQSVLKVLIEDIFIAADVPNPWVAEKKESPWFTEFAREYITRKSCSLATKDFIRAVCLNFSLELKIEEIGSITGPMCQQWYDKISANVSPGTARNRLAAVSSVFAQAAKLGIIPGNPCAGVQTKADEESVKEELSDAEVSQIVAYLASKDQREWVTAVMLSRWAGLALMDAVSFCPRGIESVGDGFIIRYTRRKTGVECVVPVCSELLHHLNKLDGLPEDAPLCQSLSQRSVASLSNEFSNLLNKAGIDTGKFEANGRARNRKTFHSLRSSFCSDLARRGVPQDLRMLMAGHRTASAHKGYVHQSASDVAARMAPFFQPTSTKP